MLQKMLAQNQFEYYRAIYLSLKFPRDFETLGIKTKDRTTLYKRSNQLSQSLDENKKTKKGKKKSQHKTLHLRLRTSITTVG